MAQCYVFLACLKVEPFDVEITSTILVCDYMASVLFDPKSTFSYVFVKFTLGWNWDGELLDIP